MNSTAFQPEWVSPPGDTISMLLHQRRQTREELAALLNLSKGAFDDLLAGQRRIDSELARSLAGVLGSTEAFWLRRDSIYQEDLLRFRARAKPDQHIDWLAEVPFTELSKLGWLRTTSSKSDQVLEMLHFFAVPTVEAWKVEYGSVLNAVAFRTSKSFQSEPGAVTAWLRRCEMEAANISCKPWNPKMFRDRLQEIRKLTRNDDPADFIPKLQHLCAECGVAVVIVKAPKGCRASGATRFVNSERAILMLSFRHLTDDHFWFSFFHEAGHLLLHGKRLFVEITSNEVSSDSDEQEANQFAELVLIPSSERERFVGLRPDLRQIMRFARDIGISTGIVVGQLQHHGKVKRNHFNNLKCRYEWASAD